MHASWADGKSKKSSFWSVFSYSTQQWTISWIVMCNEKWTLYDSQRRWAAQWLEETLKHFPKPNLHQKKSWSLSGGLLLVWSTTAFWTPVKSMRCTENCNACSWHWSTECRAHDQWFKNWMTWAKKFCLIYHIHLTSCQPTTTSSSISTTFLQGKHFHNQKAAENVCWILKHGFVCYRNKQTHFSLAKMWWL